MVKRVIGKVDGVEVILRQSANGKWEVPVPMDEDGVYVVEIMAEDYAGNRSYVAKYLFTVDTSLLCVHLVQLPYYGSLMDSSYAITVQGRALYRVEVVDEPIYSIVTEEPAYYTEVIEPVCSIAGGL